ncbi:MAG: HD-GYP domain-containing protein [Phycisphaerales bacterium]|nr:MAG: HD-GYP domain-containing protein [Phycisphaerales bacterium]
MVRVVENSARSSSAHGFHGAAGRDEHIARQPEDHPLRVLSPVIMAAWTLRKRHAVSVAVLAAVLVAAFALFLPQSLVYDGSLSLLWAELAIWGGILVVTAYMVSTLRAWTEEALRNLERAYSGVLAILSKFIETIDADTEAHCVRVAAWSVAMSRELGLRGNAIEEVRIAALLHDVGKVNISVDILRKAAALSGDERQTIQEHASGGAALVRPIGGLLGNIADVIEAHHENYDGTGYAGLKGEEIPLAARIFAVVDVWDALNSDRPYRDAWPEAEVIEHLQTEAGKHIDPHVVDIFLELVKQGRI